MRPVSMFSHQTPAGEAVSLLQLLKPAAGPERGDPLVSGWTAFGSGTMALAAALAFAARKRPPGSRVLLPAYSCPDVLAAATFAGLSVEFVDLAVDQTGMNHRQLSAALASGAGIALVVDLFGTRTDLAALRPVIDEAGAALVHDRAQSLAGPGLDPGSAADLVVTSRGRGKPATLLGGGATWSQEPGPFTDFAHATFPSAGWSPAGTALRGALYNLAMQPVVFGAVAQLPFLHLGETRLRPLSRVTRLPAGWLVHAARQLREQQALVAGRRARTLALAELLPASSFTIPTDALGSAALDGLNRLPVLCRDANQARRLVAAGSHLGISGMYGKTLPEFHGLTAIEAAERYPAAFALSRRLVTLPTHARIGATARRHLRELLLGAR